MGRRWNEKIVEGLSISIDGFLRILIANLRAKLIDFVIIIIIGF
jgi:hypothetical protein